MPTPDPTGTAGSAFTLDPFQREAIGHLDAGRSVVVAAPTGAGKTVVAEHAIALELAAGRKAFYTTPIKALSNQKYRDFAHRWGSANVGLLTGDTTINGEAPVVVMTTEVLRNMLYSSSPTLRRLGCVVLDEVHYLQDPYRGPVWEEVIVHSAPEVRLVCLSATVSNADELTRWINDVRGPTELVVETTRPVDLTNLFMVSDRDSDRAHLIPTLIDGHANPEGHRFTDTPRGRGREKSRRQRRYRTPRRIEVLERLTDKGLLPAIVFVFSRAGCAEAADALVADGVMLTDDDERSAITEIAERQTAHLRPSELDVLRYDTFLRGLQRGIAAHHAGMVPAFKEAVEECFVAGLVKLVFATETLALGINMPARAVVIERLTKFNGDSHQFLTPLEYTQLTGRAGRRGIDDQGFAVVLWSPYVTFDQVADLASSRSFGLRSVFRPTYNMAINLVRLHDRDGAHRLLDRSFGQYQADADVARLDRRRRRLREEVAGLEEQLRAAGIDPARVTASGPGNPAQQRRGDDAERESDGDTDADAETRRGIEAALGALVPGDVVAVGHDDERRPGVVVSVGYRSGGVKVGLVDRSEVYATFGADDFAAAPTPIGRVHLPTPYAPNDPSFHHDVARTLVRTRLKKRRGPSPEESGDKRNRRRGSGGDQPSRREGAALADARRRLAAVEQRIGGRSSRLARQFDDIVGVLGMLGYVSDWSPTARGDVLAGIFHECDLAIAEALHRGLFDGLGVAETAALCSCFTYEQRGPEPSVAPRIRSRDLRERLGRLEAIVAELRDLEATAGVRLTRELDTGFMSAAAGWAGGDDLAEVLDDEELSPGDFVRQVRQLVDVLHQIATVAPDRRTRSTARAAAEAINRGVIVATGVEAETDDESDDGGGRGRPVAPEPS
ncbi:MAG: DEAD/DEAH box helicase [Acidimicrobiales bacterium]